MPEVSVVMPMRNAEKFVAAAVQSVVQQDADLELVIVDDGSTDRSRAAALQAGDARVRVIDGPRQGISAAMNAGIEAARGRYLARCDADDCMPPRRLGRQAAFLDQQREFAAVCGQFCTMSRSGKVLAEMDCGNEAREITDDLRQGHICTSLCTVMVRMDVARALRFRTSFQTAEDLDFFLRLGEAGRVWFEPVVMHLYRLHGDSVTHTQPSAVRAHFEALARELQSQRRDRGRDLLMDGGRLPSPPVERGRAHGAAAHAQGVLMGASWRYLRRGRRLAAVRTGARACLLRPADWAAWRNLAALVVKRAS
jgi:glycosyltransferase involved in cell wall biosynthesis